MKKASLHVMKKDEPDPLEAERKHAEDVVKNTPKVHVLTGLPEYLKDPANFDKVQKALIETLASPHSHSDLLEWSNCVNCQRKMHAHGEMMRKLGFHSPQQYRAWVKVHSKIKERVRLR
jgi:hypothetical protein